MYQGRSLVADMLGQQFQWAVRRYPIPIHALPVSLLPAAILHRETIFQKKRII